MRSARPVLAGLGLAGLLAAAPAFSQLAPDAEGFVRKTFLNRAKVLRVEAGTSELTVTLSPGEFRGPARPSDAVVLRPGDVVRIGEVSADGRSVLFRFTSTAGAASGAVRFSFPVPSDPALAGGEELLAAAAAVFDPIARVAAATEDEAPDGEEPKTPEEEPAEPEEPEEEPAEPEEPQELRLLVEAGRPVLKGDGDDTTTLTITLRDADGRIVESRNGPVDVRLTCGRLVPEKPVMVRGRAVANLTAPVWGDEDRALDRSIEFTVFVMNRVAQFRGGDAKAELLKAAREAPYAEVRSPAKGHKPEILVVVEAFGVKGKGRVELAAAPAPRDGVSGTYEGKDVLGAAEWVFEGDLSKGTLRQKGYRDEVPVTASNDTGGMGFVGVSVGGIGTSARPLPGGRFFLLAPPILFHRVRFGTAPGSAPKEEKKPSITLTARKNPIAGDGQSSTELVFQYLDETGHPVGGLAVEWALDRFGVLPPAQRGTLVATQDRTGEDGTARAVYRAPSLEAGDMQQTGTVKNRDVTVSWAGPKGKGEVTCAVGILKAASLRLVVEKPGVDRAVFPMRVGSLNGTIEGTVLLENVPPRGPGAAARFPLADAVVKLEGDEKVLRWAAVEPGRTDAKGRFRIRMRMSNWERWDRKLDRPLLVKASPLFLARLSQCHKHLGEWPASPEVVFEKWTFLYRAQQELAALTAADAKGLTEKLWLTGLLAMTLKDARKDGGVAARELLTHGKDLFVGIASWFYADSRLEKAVNEQVKALEGSVGIQELRKRYARWLHREGAPLARRVLAWLSSRIGLGTDLPRDGLGMRSAFRKVLVPKLLEALAGVIAEWMPETSLGDLAVERMLTPYVERGDRILLAFLKNRDYRLVASTASTSGAHLTVHLGRMREEVQKVAAWRLSEETAKAFVDAGTEWVTLSMKVAAALTLNDAVWKAAEAIEKGKEKVDTVVAGVRMGEEWHRLSGILAASEEEARECVVRSAGVTLPTAALPLPPRGGREAVVHAGLFPSGAVEGAAAPDLVPLFETASAPPAGEEEAELLVRLSLAREASDAWLVESLPSLLALKESRPAEAAALAGALGRWEAALDEGRADAMARLAGAGGRPAGEIASRLTSEAKAWQARRDAAIEATRALPPETDSALLAEAESRTARWRLPAPGRLVRWAVAAAGLAGLCGLLLAAGVAFRRAARSRREYPPRMVVPPSRAAGVREPSPRGAAGPHLADNMGEVHLLDRPVLTIGAARENDVVVRLPGVSRRHGQILRDAGGEFWLEDVGSRYGSTVNGAVVTRARLTHGDEIAMGGWRATVNLD